MKRDINSKVFCIPQDFCNIEGVFEQGAHGIIRKCRTSSNDNESKTLAVKLTKISKDVGVLNPVEFAILTSIDHPYLQNALMVCYIEPYIMAFQKLLHSDLRKYMKNNMINKIKCREQLIKAVDILHNNNIIHCDIKSNNILITSDGNIKLTDFSFSILSKGENFKHRVSTWTHVPIECLIMKGWSFPLDIWCLGCTLYEIEYGNLLFEFQGTSKTNLTNREELLPHHDRHVNALYDWGVKGPNTDESSLELCSTIKFKDNIEYKTFNSTEIKDELILKCLHFCDFKRPSISDLMQELEIMNESYSTYTKKSKINTELNNKVSSNIYSMIDIEMDETLKVETCELLARKITGDHIAYPIRSDLRSAELEICNDLHWRLIKF